MAGEQPLIIVSNRGPARFERGEGGERTVARGGGGLVTALTGLATHRKVLWVASAMSDEDAAVARESGGPVEVELEDASYEVEMVASEPAAYDLFYSVIANPQLWFTQHYLWDLSNAPDIRADEKFAWQEGYKVVNEDIAAAVLRHLREQEDQKLVMFHDYHLYTAPAIVRDAVPDAFLHHFVHIPWPHPDAWRILPRVQRDEIYDGLLSNDIIGFHTSSYVHNFLDCCRELVGCEVDYRHGIVHYHGREIWIRAYPLGIDADRLRRVAGSAEVAAYERELLARRREHLIIRVDRADLSKNVLRGFTAFDQFLADHPEFHERVTFIAHLQPSRQDVAEYQEYLERIEALVAVVNHRHGTTDWMPIDLRIYENFHEAVARYKHFDLLMVNSIFDGMNLVAKEAPAVNMRDGVLMLSENTGSHEELGECALSVNPFDIEEQATAIHKALTMSAEERRERASRLREIVDATDPGIWIDHQLADIRRKRDG